MGDLHAQGQTWHVSLVGSDANPGISALPFRTIQRAADVVLPGDTILVHPGTYDGQVEITRSGAPGKPIVLKPLFEDSDAILSKPNLQAELPTRACDERTPAFARTIRFVGGADYWIVQKFEIVGGVFVGGSNTEDLVPYIRDRTLPGRGTNDPIAARGTLQQLGVDGADHIKILNNTIRGRGIYTAGARYGRIQGNEIYDIICGTGSAVWLNLFSDGWTIRENDIHDIESVEVHWMGEGIRIGSASMYNLVEFNTITDLLGKGRGITTDVNANWNTLRRNYTARADVGFSEQSRNLGNKWLYNLGENNRKTNFDVAAHLYLAKYLTKPEMIPERVLMRCNESRGNVDALRIGRVKKSTFEKNKFSKVVLSSYARAEWTQFQNTWDGSTKPPPLFPSTASFSKC